MIYPMRTIVAGVAELEGEDAVLASAVRLAERTRATLHLVHAFELPALMWDAYARMGYMHASVLEEYTDSVRERLEQRVSQLTQNPRVQCHAIAGPPAPAIRELADRKEADLVLVGATRHGTLARTILGTTAQRVVRGAPMPVLVLRNALPERLERVLLTTDLSPFSAGIHEAALDVLETLYDGHPRARSLLVVLYRMELPPPLSHEELSRISRESLDRFLAERRYRGVPVEGVVRFGEPAKEIVAEAADWNPDLVVMGTHGRQGTDRWLLGSVAEAALRGATGNVLVIPARVEERRKMPVPQAVPVQTPQTPQSA